MLNIAGTLTMGPDGDITNEDSDYTINNDGVILGDNTSINLGTNSVITNNDGDFRLDADGLSMEATDQFQLIPERAVTFHDGASLIGGMYARTDDNSLWIQSEPGSNIKLVPRSTANYVEINGGYFRLPTYSDANRPSNPEPGALIFNTDANGIQVAGNNGNWGGI